MTVARQLKRDKASPVLSPGDVVLTADEVAAAVGITRTTLARLVSLGVLEPTRRRATMFTADVVPRLRRVMRLHADLGVNFVGAAIIVDLVARLDRLNAELAHRSRDVRGERRRWISID